MYRVAVTPLQVELIKNSMDHLWVVLLSNIDNVDG